MTLQNELTEMLNAANESILSNPKGELVLPLRKKLWKALGVFKSISNAKAVPTIGLRRRVKLASLCVKKVLNVWEEIEPDDQRPHKMLEIADKYIYGAISYESVLEQLNDFIDDLTNLVSEERFFYAVEVGLASVRVVSISLRDEELMIYYDDNILDNDLDSFSWDCSYFTAIAYSGSGPWENTNIDKRREFWLWYVNEAVPQAFRSYSE